MKRSVIGNLLRHEAAGGVVLMLAAVAALIIANSDYAAYYQSWLDAVLAVTLDDEGLRKPLILWINDGLMAIFFFLVGLELKRELLEGKLREPRDVILPGVAAVGGMLVPALIYAALNWNNPETIDGWAIPAATDIAFALGVLALLGSRVPAALKIFLLSIAILDDVGAILIIALFYTAQLQVSYLGAALIPLAGLLALNLYGYRRVAPYVLLAIVMWVFVLKSGVHATLAGVVAAFTIPLVDRWGKSPLHSTERALTPYVAFFVVPVFAFANSGVILEGLTLGDLLDPLTMGIVLGLVVGKQIGVFGATWLMVRTGYAALPHGANWLHIYGVACLAGIGFTMSLFIGSLSFANNELTNMVRLGVLTASTIAALMGVAALLAAGRQAAPEADPEPDPEAELAA